MAYKDENPRVRALKLLLDDFENPNRDLRIAAQVLDCGDELRTVLAWLQAEIESEILIETMWDG